MASPISHIIYAKKYLEKFPSREINTDEFMLGCVFPDIRRIDESIKRKDTHLCFGKCDMDFSGLTSFQAGWKFHVFCDMKREEILNKYNFYSLEHTTDFWSGSAKFLEDELIYGEYDNWEKTVNYFNNPPEIDTGILVTRETFELWNAMLAKYCEKNPDNKTVKNFLSKQPALADKAGEIVAAIDKLRKNDRVVELLKGVMERIV